MASCNALRPTFGRLLSIRAPQSLATTTSVSPPSIIRLQPSVASFSTTPTHYKIETRDNNRHRGVSSLRRSGLRRRVSVSDEPLPRPVNYVPEIEVDPNHGLYQFFRGPNKLLNTPEEDNTFGRAWTTEELRKKDWEDLQKLWWICCKERNVIATADRERARAKMGFGDVESEKRDAEVRKTMKAIRHVLTERFYLWEDARKLALNDPEINLTGNGPAYVQSYEAEEDDAWLEDETKVSGAGAAPKTI